MPNPQEINTEINYPCVWRGMKLGDHMFFLKKVFNLEHMGVYNFLNCVPHFPTGGFHRALEARFNCFELGWEPLQPPHAAPASRCRKS